MATAFEYVAEDCGEPQGKSYTLKDRRALITMNGKSMDTGRWTVRTPTVGKLLRIGFLIPKRISSCFRKARRTSLSY